MVKTIKISDEKYKLLLKIAARLQEKRQKKISIDEALGSVLLGNKKEFSILELAGTWNSLSEEDAAQLIESTYKSRKIHSRRI